ncbi:hypothetical protein [Sphingopyxis granuli]|uniref:hypothetical protein n=1 Tax=Sphingopyxis granuli TaxID=267128 RepID=UPI001BB04A7B|nr:hypothetical protein [Sphingopyxis granuli]QUM72686.1 hypothetical protein ICN83_01715 [Sphingopyxis granuli]
MRRFDDPRGLRRLREALCLHVGRKVDQLLEEALDGLPVVAVQRLHRPSSDRPVPIVRHS